MIAQSTKEALLKVNFEDIEQIKGIASQIKKYLEEHPGSTIQSAFGITDEALEEMYAVAYTMYDQGKYPQSLTLFEFLAGICPSNFKYLMGFAASLHEIGLYKEAGLTFFMAYNLNPEHLMAAYYSIEALLKGGLKEEALEVAGLALEVSEIQPEHRELRERILLIIKKIK